MIVLEGPDGAGKSTLGSMLLRDRVITSLQESPGRTRKQVPLMDQTLRYLRIYGSEPRVAVDRFLFSEMVYGPILREKSQFSQFNYMGILSELVHRHAIIIFCLPPVDDLKFKEDESPLVIQKIHMIHGAYEHYLQQISRMYDKIYRYNWKTLNAYDDLLRVLPKPEVKA